MNNFESLTLYCVLKALSFCFPKLLCWCSCPLIGQAILVAKLHGGFIRTRWAVLPYKLSRVKNTGLASPRPTSGEQRAAGPPISFPCPSQACQ